MSFDSQLKDILDEVLEDTTEVLNNEMEKVGKLAVKELKATSPKNTGKYSKGWAAEIKKDILGVNVVTVYNKKKPGLTHLLENGHIKRGGRGYVSGIPHIRPVEDMVQRELLKNIERKLKK